MEGKNAKYEEKKKFLESKMNEEEIAEAFRRYNREKEGGKPAIPEN